jgi:hemoglobin
LFPLVIGAALGRMSETPTLYEWAGGTDALLRLTDVFYARVRKDELLAPLFERMPPEHPRFVATWLAEVFGGPADYTSQHGGYPHMLGKHLGLAITEQQRRRWVDLMYDAADEADLPADPEFRAAFASYLEWGTRLARQNSQPGADVVRRAPVPRWGWGEAPPYRP